MACYIIAFLTTSQPERSICLGLVKVAQQSLRASFLLWQNLDI